MPGSSLVASTPLDFVVHSIQLALTPVFLLSGIATLLNVFSTRLARVADRVEQVLKAVENGDSTQLPLLVRLRWRSIALDVAVVLAAVGAAATCASVLTLFVGAVEETTVANWLFATFGIAVGCALGSILAFAVEMMLAGSGVRAVVDARGTSPES